MAANDIAKIGQLPSAVRAWRPTHLDLRRIAFAGQAVTAAAISLVGVKYIEHSYDSSLRQNLAVVTPQVATTSEAGSDLQAIVRDGCVTIPAHFSQAPTSSELAQLRHNPPQVARRMVAQAMRSERAKKMAITTAGSRAVRWTLQQTTQATRNIQLPYVPGSVEAGTVQRTYDNHLTANIAKAVNQQAAKTQAAWRSLLAAQNDMLQQFPYSFIEGAGFHGYFQDKATSIGLDPTFGRPINQDGSMPPLNVAEAVTRLPDSAQGECF